MGRAGSGDPLSVNPGYADMEMPRGPVRGGWTRPRGIAKRGGGQAAGIYRGAWAVEPRTTSSGSKSSSPGCTSPSRIWVHSNSTAARPIASMG